MMRSGPGCGLLLVVLATCSASQQLKPRELPGTWCAPVEVRIAAKLVDGSAASLTEPDLRVGFDRGPADVISVRSFASVAGEGGLTDILFVLPPYSDLAASSEVKGIVNTLARAEGFRFRAAVLGPDGVGSGYSGEISVLDKRLRAAQQSRHWVHGMRPWVRAEQEAFLALRRLPGRHVIVRLFTGTNARYPVQKNFLLESSLDSYAVTDLTMVYRLMAPVNLTLTIPGGEAATEASRIGDMPDLRAERQTFQLGEAIQTQADLWADRSEARTATAGSAATSTAVLMQDVIHDLDSAYDVVVQPHFACRDAGLHAVSVVSTRREVRVFAPRAMQMISYAAK